MKAAAADKAGTKPGWKWRLAQWLEIRWWKVYLRDKNIESYLEWKRNYWHGFLEKAGFDAQLSGNSSILDAGSGPAGVFMVLQGHKVTAVDPLIDTYQRSLAHFDPARYPWVDFRCQQIEQTIGNEEYSIIFCLNVINHVHQPDVALANLSNALKTGGRLILSIDVHRFEFMRDVFRKIPLDALHPQQDTKKDYIAACEQQGLRLMRHITMKRGWIFNYDVMILEKAQEKSS